MDNAPCEVTLNHCYHFIHSLYLQISSDTYSTCSKPVLIGKYFLSFGYQLVRILNESVSFIIVRLHFQATTALSTRFLVNFETITDTRC